MNNLRLSTISRRGAVVLRRLGVVLVQSRTDDVVGAFQQARTSRQAGKDQNDRAVGADVAAADLALTVRNDVAGDVAGRNDAVIGLARHMQTDRSGGSPRRPVAARL